MGCKLGGTSKRCTYEIYYMDNDSSSGVLARDTISNEDGKLSKEVIFGCGEQNQGEHYSGVYSGILGFGRHPYSFVGQVGVTKFSFCLGGEGSQTTLYLNEIPPMEDDDLSTFHTSLITNWDRPEDYYIGFEGISIDGDKVPITQDKWKLNSTS
ncbi:hypothetical protein Tsubulata_047469, partial [Turnera subulata]